MSVRFVKATLLLLPIFCSLSKTSCFAHALSGNRKPDVTSQSAGYYPVVHLLMPHQATVPPFQPTAALIAVALNNTDRVLYLGDRLLKDDGTRPEHCYRFYRLILFPFHGFW